MKDEAGGGQAMMAKTGRVDVAMLQRVPAKRTVSQSLTGGRLERGGETLMTSVVDNDQGCQQGGSEHSGIQWRKTVQCTIRSDGL